MERATAKTWDGLSRMAFAADWNPEAAIDWDQRIELEAVKDAWVTILQHFYAGEWQGLEVIQRLMNRAAHLFKCDGMVTYYSTQCYDESKHLFVFRRYLQKLDSLPARSRAVELLVRLATMGPMAVERWILATYFTETLAATIFSSVLELDAIDSTAKQMIRLMLKDESRHIAGTRLGVQTLLKHAGPVKTALLKTWWRLFIRLAVSEVRRLKSHGDQVGSNAETVLRKTFARMASLKHFQDDFTVAG